MSENLPAIQDVNQYLIRTADVDVREVIQTNLGVTGITEFDLDKAKVPAGGVTLWQIDTIQGRKSLETLEGIIVFQRPDFSYYSTSFESRQQAAPPDCSSRDGMTGVGKPGGVCATCPFNQFGSAPDERGKACRQRTLLFMLRPDSLLPMLVVVPTMSVGPVRKYLMRLAGGGLVYHAVVTSLGLEEAKSSANITYGRILPRMLQQLPPDQAAATAEYAQMIKPYMERYDVREEEDEELSF